MLRCAASAFSVLSSSVQLLSDTNAAPSVPGSDFANKLRHAQYLRPSLFPVKLVANDIVLTLPL